MAPDRKQSRRNSENDKERIDFDRIPVDPTSNAPHSLLRHRYNMTASPDFSSEIHRFPVDILRSGTFSGNLHTATGPPGEPPRPAARTLPGQAAALPERRSSGSGRDNGRHSSPLSKAPPVPDFEPADSRRNCRNQYDKPRKFPTRCRVIKLPL